MYISRPLLFKSSFLFLVPTGVAMLLNIPQLAFSVGILFLTSLLQHSFAGEHAILKWIDRLYNRYYVYYYIFGIGIWKRHV